MTVFIEHDISGHTLILLAQKYGHKLWVGIVAMIDDHGTKVAQDSGHIQCINSISYDHCENVI